MGNKKSKTTEPDLTILDENKIEELCAHSKLTRNDILKMHSDFLVDCPNGKLDKKKFTTLYKQLYPQGDSKKFSNICFLAYDKDKNGYIDFYEFVGVMAILTKGNIEDKLRLAFDIYDFNKDGFIEAQEAEVIVDSLLKMYGDDSSMSDIKHEITKLMKRFDKDNNNVLSMQEFIDGCLNDKELINFFVPIV